MISIARLDSDHNRILQTLLIIIVIVSGGLISIVPDPILVVAALLVSLLVAIYCVHIEVGLYMLVLALPLRHLEKTIGGVIGVSPVDLVLWPWILVYGIKMLFQKPGFQKSKTYILILAWLFANLLSGLSARNLASWAVAVVSCLIYSATLIATFNELSQRPQVLKRIMNLYLGVSLIVVVVGGLQVAGVIPYQIVDPFSGRMIGSSERFRMGSFLTNANFLAAYLAVPLFFSWTSHSNTHGVRRFGYLVAFFTLLIVIIFTFSRAGFLGLAAGGGVFFLGGGKKLKRLQGLIVGVLVVGLVLIGLFGIYDKVFEETSRGGAVQAMLEGNIRQADRSVRTRFTLIRTAFDMFRSSPVIGIGSGQFMTEFPRFRVPEFQYDKILNAHNMYMQILAEGGIIGLVSFTLLLGRIFLEAIKMKMAYGTLAGTLTGVLAGFVALLVIGLTHNMIRSEMWFVAGLVMAYTRVLRSNNLALSSSL